jgi:hypothetical protein
MPSAERSKGCQRGEPTEHGNANPGGLAHGELLDTEESAYQHGLQRNVASARLARAAVV